VRKMAEGLLFNMIEKLIGKLGSVVVDVENNMPKYFLKILDLNIV
jgi:hypothetical protein